MEIEQLIMVIFTWSMLLAAVAIAKVNFAGYNNPVNISASFHDFCLCSTWKKDFCGYYDFFPDHLCHVLNVWGKEKNKNKQTNKQTFLLLLPITYLLTKHRQQHKAHTKIYC